MTDETITVRVVQQSPVLGDVARNEEKILSALESAAEDAVDLVVFPELFLTGYHIGQGSTEGVVGADTSADGDTNAIVDAASDALHRIESMAPNLTAIVGAPVREDEMLYNSAVVFDNGERVGTYHKTHLYGAEGTLFEPGPALATIETSVGTLGVQICYDVEFPEVSRELVSDGAHILLTLSANMRPFALDQRIYLRARALENIRPHVLCNRIGDERGVDFFGASGIVDERGRTLASADEDISTEVTTTVSLHGTGEQTLQYFEDRRPALYGE